MKAQSIRMALIAGLLLTCSVHVVAQTPTYVPGVVLVKTHPGVLRTQINTMTVENIAVDSLRILLSQLRVQTIEKVFLNSRPSDTSAFDLNGNAVKLIDLSGWLKLTFDGSTALSPLLAVLSAAPGIAKAHLDPMIERTETFPNEIDNTDKQRLQWGLYNPDARAQGQVRDINAPFAWDIQRGRNDVVVAVVDDGVDHSHLDLDSGSRSRVIFGWNFNSDNDNTMPDPGKAHGTRVAGVIGAITNNGFVYGQNSVAGVMWNCSIMPLKAAPPLSLNANAINWARTHGANIVNISWTTDGSLGDFDALKEAVANAYKQGLALPSAMGENGDGSVRYPAALFGAIAVGGTDKFDVRIPESNFGSHISVVAPGVDHRTTNPGGTYVQFGGTSLSAPLVAGAVGLILSQSRDRGLNLSNDDVKHLLEATADDKGDPGWDPFYGFGRINVGRAVQAVNTPYTVTRTALTGGNVAMTRDFHQRAFFASYYLGGLATATYICKQYRVTWHVNFPTAYSQTPFVWVRERECNGWYGDGSTSGVLQDPWAKVTNVTTTGFDIETYVYWIESNLLGQQIRKYWPGNTDNIQTAVAYTAVGIPQPLVVTITGPGELNWKDWGTWTANPLGGTGSYLYEWRYRDYPGGAWSNVLSTSNQYTRQMPPNDIELQVKVTSGGIDVYDTHIVQLGDGTFAQRQDGEGVQRKDALPQQFSVSQNFPNPFNPQTEISFALSEPSSVRLTVLDVLGREIAVLEERALPAGYRTVLWNGRNAKGESVGSGVYFYHLSAVGESGKSFVRTMKMIVAK